MTFFYIFFMFSSSFSYILLWEALRLILWTTLGCSFVPIFGRTNLVRDSLGHWQSETPWGDMCDIANRAARKETFEIIKLCMKTMDTRMNGEYWSSG